MVCAPFAFLGHINTFIIWIYESVTFDVTNTTVGGHHLRCLCKTEYLKNCVYVIVVCMCTWVCACASKCMCVTVKARGWHQVFSSTVFHLIIWDKLSHWTQRSPINYAGLSAVPRDPPVSIPADLDCRHMPPQPALGWLQIIKTCFSILAHMTEPFLWPPRQQI